MEQAVLDHVSKLDLFYADLANKALREVNGGYAEVWVCEACPDHIAVYNTDDEIVACYPLPIANHVTRSESGGCIFLP